MRPYSSAVLTLGGVLLMGLGVYFVALRPPLLAEDLRFIGLSLGQVQRDAPGLFRWLRTCSPCWAVMPWRPGC